MLLHVKMKCIFDYSVSLFFFQERKMELQRELFKQNTLIYDSGLMN